MKYLLFLLLLSEGSNTSDSLKAKIEKLFKDASLWRVSENIEKVDKAREELTSIGEPALKYIFSQKLKTESTLELRAIKHIVKELRREALPYVREAMRSENDTVRRNAEWLAGELKDTASLDTLLNLLNREKRIRNFLTVIIALSKIGDERAIEPLMEYVDTSEERIREAVAVAFMKIPGAKSIPPLYEMLNDSFFTVRGTAARGIVRKISLNFYKFLDILENGDQRKRVELLRAIPFESDSIKKLGELERIQLKSELIKMLDDSSWVIRGYAVRALSSEAFKDFKEVKNEIFELKGRETHPFVIREIERALEKF